MAAVPRDLIDVAAKCRVLFFNKFRAQGDRSQSLSAKAQCMSLTISQDECTAHKNDPSDLGIPTHFFFTNGRIWNPKEGGLLNQGCMTPCEPCLLRRRNHGRYASCSFSQPVWDNLHNVILPDGARSARYMVIHNIIPTNVRSHRIRLMDTENCIHCRR
jgi:hypothetical protein